MFFSHTPNLYENIVHKNTCFVPCMRSSKMPVEYQNSSHNRDAFPVQPLSTTKSSFNEGASNLSPFDVRCSQETKCATLATGIESDTLYTGLSSSFIGSFVFPAALLSHSAMTQRASAKLYNLVIWFTPHFRLLYFS